MHQPAPEAGLGMKQNVPYGMTAGSGASK